MKIVLFKSFLLQQQDLNWFSALVCDKVLIKIYNHWYDPQCVHISIKNMTDSVVVFSMKEIVEMQNCVISFFANGSLGGHSALYLAANLVGCFTKFYRDGLKFDKVIGKTKWYTF